MNEEIKSVLSEEFNFSAGVQNRGFAAFTHLKLFNGYNEIVAEGYGNMQVKVPRGLYQLRIEMNEHVEDRNYRVVKDVSDYSIDINTTSATPLYGLTSTHEYFSNPSVEWSRKSTFTGQYMDRDSLFIFLRYSDKQKSFDQFKDPEKGFRILNTKREIIFSFGKENTKSGFGKAEEYFGFIAFHEKVMPGQYYLQYQGKKVKREMPLYIFAGWQTQLFMMVKDEPMFSSVRISIERGGFSPENDQNMQLDALIQKMYNGIYYLPDDLKQAAAYGKWQNPMLGIIGSYMYLMTDDTKDDTLFETIIGNLENFILANHTAPDVIALRLLAALHTGKPPSGQSLPGPCMLGAGMSAFLKQSLLDNNLVKKGSLMERIFTNVRTDSIWTSYLPLPVKRKTKAGALKPKTDVPSDSYVHVSGSRSKPTAKPFRAAKDWITATIFGELSQGQQSTVFNIASQMQITSSTVKSTLTKLNNPENLYAVASSVLGENVPVQEIEDRIKAVQDKISDLLG